MSGKDHLQLFKSASHEWICKGYSVEIRYIAEKLAGDIGRLLACSLFFWPIEDSSTKNLKISTNHIFAGRVLLNKLSLNKLKHLINEVEQGKITIDGELSLSLESKGGVSYFTEICSTERWFCDGHLQIMGDSQQVFTTTQITKINNDLRLAETPFDGIDDLLSSLNLVKFQSFDKYPHIEVRISPPVDIIFNSTKVSNGFLELVLHAHSELDVSKVSLAVRTLSIKSPFRKQVANEIKWVNNDEQKVGTLKLKTNDAFSILCILMFGGNTVRRQYFEDASKAPNHRYFVSSFFDNDLKMLKKGLTDTNQDNFEKAVSSLAFLLGFSPSIPNERDAPDVILSSPNNNIVLVECTTRINDFSTKLGKLVTRKNSLIQKLKDSGHNKKVYAYLVCGLPKIQIAQNEEELASHRVSLLTKESLNQLLNEVNVPHDLEKLLSDDEKILDDILLQKT